MDPLSGFDLRLVFKLPPRENWFQYIFRVYATAINFPCIITLIVDISVDSHERGVLQCTAVYCSVLRCTALYCSVLRCTAVYCSVLLCSTVHCGVLQCTAVYCSVLQITEAYGSVVRKAIKCES